MSFMWERSASPYSCEPDHWMQSAACGTLLQDFRFTTHQLTLEVPP